MEREHSQTEVSEIGVSEIGVSSNGVSDDREQTGDVVGQQNMNNASNFSQSYNYSQQQLQWTDRQVTTIERQLLLNNYRASASGSVLSNWTKVFLCTLSVIIPGIGQLVGLISGLVMISNDNDSDKRSYGAALLTVSIIIFVIQLIFWFLFALTTGPDLFY